MDIIFDVKLDGFCHKARLVAGGHQTEPPASVLTYASVVSRETMWIAFTIATLNDLQVKASDIQNTCRKNLYCIRVGIWCRCRKNGNYCACVVWPQVSWSILPKASGRLHANTGLQS